MPLTITFEFKTSCRKLIARKPVKFEHDSMGSTGIQVEFTNGALVTPTGGFHLCREGEWPWQGMIAITKWWIYVMHIMSHAGLYIGISLEIINAILVDNWIKPNLPEWNASVGSVMKWTNTTRACRTVKGHDASWPSTELVPTHFVS